jgi:hypothetical protein
MHSEQGYAVLTFAPFRKGGMGDFGMAASGKSPLAPLCQRGELDRWYRASTHTAPCLLNGMRLSYIFVRMLFRV